MMAKRRKLRPWSNTASMSGWAESTYAELSWDKARSAASRWAMFGIVIGALVALVVFAPAAWLARAVASATKGHVQLADARGTVWSGSAVAVLTGGEGSRDASALPGRIEWTLAWRGLAFELQARHACCLNGAPRLRLQPGLGRVRVTLAPGTDWIGQWPTAWLGGLGTPWNTLQLGGTLRLISPGLTLESAQGRWSVSGKADLELLDVSSRVSTLNTLGSYRLTLTSDAAGTSQLSLKTQQGPLQLTGDGSIGLGGVRFRGEARAGEGDEAALSNLLNIIGRRDGARSVISIG